MAIVRLTEEAISLVLMLVELGVSTVSALRKVNTMTDEEIALAMTKEEQATDKILADRWNM